MCNKDNALSTNIINDPRVNNNVTSVKYEQKMSTPTRSCNLVSPIDEKFDANIKEKNIKSLLSELNQRCRIRNNVNNGENSNSKILYSKNINIQMDNLYRPYMNVDDLQTNHANYLNEDAVDYPDANPLYENFNSTNNTKAATNHPDDQRISNLYLDMGHSAKSENNNTVEYIGCEVNEINDLNAFSNEKGEIVLFENDTRRVPFCYGSNSRHRIGDPGCLMIKESEYIYEMNTETFHSDAYPFIRKKDKTITNNYCECHEDLNASHSSDGVYFSCENISAEDAVDSVSISATAKMSIWQKKFQQLKQVVTDW